MQTSRTAGLQTVMPLAKFWMFLRNTYIIIWNRKSPVLDVWGNKNVPSKDVQSSKWNNHLHRCPRFYDNTTHMHPPKIIYDGFAYLQLFAYVYLSGTRLPLIFVGLKFQPPQKWPSLLIRNHPLKTTQNFEGKQRVTSIFVIHLRFPRCVNI